MTKIKPEVLIKLSEFKGLTTYHYKIILYLLGSKEVTQSKMAEILGVKKQNINKTFKVLSSSDIIRVNRVEGSNIFWSLNPNPSFEIKGQLKIDV